MITAFGLALRALWWRRGVSLVVLAIASFVAAAASAGPLYLRAGGESILQDTLRSAPTSSTGLEVRLQVAPTPGQLGRLSTEVTAARAGVPYWREQIGGLELDAISVQTYDGSVVGTTRVVYREEMCEHLTFSQGGCPEALGEAAISASALESLNFRFGQELDLGSFRTDAGPRALRITGVYTPTDTGDDYWFSRAYFTATGVSAGAEDDAIDAVFVPEVTFTGLVTTTPVRTVVNLPLDDAAVDVSRTADVIRGLAAIRDRMRKGSEASVDSGIVANLDAAKVGRDALEVPVLLIVVQLLVLSWFVLFMIVASSAEARGGEIALAKARGLRPGSTLAFGLLETLLLLVVSIPLGLLLAMAGVRLLASRELLEGTPVRLVPLAVGAAAVAALGGLVAAGLAASRTLRTPVLELWRRATSGRQGGRRNLAADAAVLTLAGAGLLQLALGGTLRGSEDRKVDVIALLAPGLLALGVALIGARLLPVLCRAGFGVTRGSRWVGTFLGLRQVARRPSGLRVVVILTIAFGLSTFSVLGWTVLRDNRSDRAQAETGAARSLTVDVRPGTDLLEAVRAADPGGRHAMAVLVPEGTSSTKLLLGVDSPRFATVGFWRSDFADDDIAAIAKRLRPDAPDPLLVAGDGVGVRVTTTRLAAEGAVSVVVDVQRSGGQRESVPVGTLTAGTTQTLRGTVSGCAADPCRLLRVRLDRPVSSFPISGTVVLEQVQVRAAGTWAPLGGDSLTRPDRWRSLNRGDYAPPDSLLPGSGGLRFDFAAPASSTVGVAPIDTPTPLPALVTRELIDEADDGRFVELTGLDRSALLVDAVARSEVIPRAGRSAAMVDLEYLQRQSSAAYSVARREVWVGADAPDDLEEKLAEQGVTVLTERAAEDREEVLARQAPSLALLLFLVGAGIAALLAAGGTVLDVYLLGRRRSYELAAMLALGLKRRSLLTGVLVEQALLIGSGTLLGVTTGYAGARLALPSVPLYTDTSTFPPPLFEPDPRVVLLMVAAVVIAMAVAVLVAALLLVRSAVPSRLREVQA